MRYSTAAEKRAARKRRKELYRAFDTSLFTGCCVCQLCGIDRCPSGLALMIFNQRPYEICPECMNDRSVWAGVDSHGEPTPLPQKPASREGQFHKDGWRYWTAWRYWQREKQEREN